MRSGRKSLSQTPSPQKDRIRGSRVNPKGSASSSTSGESIELSESIVNTLENKRDEYNKKHPNGKVTLGTLKAVFRRGAGAYSSSHRPTITGGAPNSRSAWAFARVNKFLLKKGGTKVKAAYVQDDDLMAKGGLLSVNGEPITFYHGTTDKGYGSYNYLYFTADKDYATEYAEGRGRVIEVNIKMNNPFVIEAKYMGHGEIILNDEIIGFYRNLQSDAVEKLKNEGYDGIVVNYPYKNKKYFEVIPFSKNQIIGETFSMGGLIAPNGKPSNLTPKQYKLVRTIEFKAWFGDWENDPENSSKVVDENGEPLVVYRGWSSNKRLSNIYSYDVNMFGSQGISGRSKNQFGFYFSGSKSVAKGYAKDFTEEYNTDLDYNKSTKKRALPIVQGYFLNIRNICNITPSNPKFPSLDNFIEVSKKENGSWMSFKEIKNRETKLYPTEIGVKSLCKLIGITKKDVEYISSEDGYLLRKYNSNSPKAIYDYFINNGNGYDSFFKYKIEENNYDGVLFQEYTYWGIELSAKEIREIDRKDDKLESEVRNYPNVFVAFEPNQIKLADGSNTTFDASNPDIRYEEGGDLGQEITCVNCGWHWNTKDSDAFDKYVCHKCGFDNRTFYDSDPMSKKYKDGGLLNALNVGMEKLKKNGIVLRSNDGEVTIIAYNTGNQDRKPSLYNKALIYNSVEPIKSADEIIHKLDYQEFDNFSEDNIDDYKSSHLIILNQNEVVYDSENPDLMYDDGGLIAPNGNKSNLTPEQYKLVRTPEFKAWFGDWENDPENASKVVDENGEPLVMWHYSKRLQYESDKFYKFNVDKQLGSHFGTIKQAQNLKYIPSGESEVRTSIKELTDFRYYQVFLNIRKPLRLKDVGIFEEQTILDEINLIRPLKGYDWEYFNQSRNKSERLNRIKDWLLRTLNIDGIIYLNRYESNKDSSLISSLDDVSDEVFKIKVPDAEDSWIAFYPQQIKLADGSNTTFDANNPDIRYDDGGKLKKPHTIIEIAEKHKIKVSEVVKALRKGVKFEKEHTKDEEIAKTIAKHHLWESPLYYEKLKEMEETFEDGGIFVLDEIALPDAYANIETLKRVLSNQGYEIVKSVKNEGIFESGGMVVGKSHQEADENGTGEKFKLKTTGQIVELEGGEAVIVGKAIDSEDKIRFDGEERTPREIASYLNHAYGGVKFEKGGHITCGCSHKKYYHGGELPSAVVNSLNGGEAVITKKTMESKDKYDYEGEKLTPRQILSRINHRYGGVSFAKGGKLTKFTNNPINIASKMIYFVNNMIYE